eukprot:13455490-Ditylum_brightwellii.AAC.1
MNNLTCNFIIRKDKTKTDLATYIHACSFSPPMQTLQQAVRKGHLLSPGIHNLNFQKLLRTTKTTALNHLDQERSNQQSTKQQKILDDAFPTDNNGIKTHETVALIVPFHPKHTTFIDQTGRLPCKSSR